MGTEVSQGVSDHKGAITEFTGRHAFLSNFAPASFTYAGITWPTSEHAFQAMKHPDPVTRFSYPGIRTPSEVKRVGRIQPLRHDWEDVKRRIMLEIVLAKFSQNRELQLQLAKTSPELLVEGNTWGDNYWGAVSVQGKGAWPYENGVMLPGWPILLAGHNWLGRILMMARDVLS